MPIKTTVATIFECALVALGWTLIWRLHFSSTAREKRKASPTPVSRWDLNKKNLLLITLWAVLVFALYSRFALLSMLTGALVALFAIQAESLHPVASSPIARPIIKATFRDIGWVGLVTFLAVISVVYPVQLLWEQLLILLHLPTAKQELVELFNHPESFSKTAILAVNAVIIAPITEELFFRGGLFRSLNRCVPRWLAFWLPALVFASLHVNYKTLEGLVTLAPLTAFGLVFSFAYEKTGRIAVVMIAHALFNLHTVIFLLLGLGV